MSEQNKAAVRRLFEAISADHLDAIDELVTEDAVDHEELPGFDAGLTGRERVRAVFAMFRSAFPDFSVEAHDMIAEDDKVSVRATMRGTHQGEFMGIPATGNEVAVPFIDHFRMKDGKMAEHWGVTDTGAMMEQLGVTGP